MEGKRKYITYNIFNFRYLPLYYLFLFTPDKSWKLLRKKNINTVRIKERKKQKKIKRKVQKDQIHEILGFQRQKPDG